jgi:hypothetical protein
MSRRVEPSRSGPPYQVNDGICNPSFMEGGLQDRGVDPAMFAGRLEIISTGGMHVSGLMPVIPFEASAGSSVGIERLPSKQRVAGSNPARRTL